MKENSKKQIKIRRIKIQLTAEKIYENIYQKTYEKTYKKINLIPENKEEPGRPGLFCFTL
ncbi:MAG: hypothetical protein BWY75_02353 [bacterium ADurb.Bin425]|nr:MAG: hypothetical protein BWY75_02353 [bacterium ADurb.Bin425]